jgi:hypothetical protein
MGGRSYSSVGFVAEGDDHGVPAPEARFGSPTPETALDSSRPLGLMLHAGRFDQVRRPITSASDAQRARNGEVSARRLKITNDDEHYTSGSVVTQGTKGPEPL